MSFESTLKRGRKLRLDDMKSQCTITRPGGTEVFNPETGEYELHHRTFDPETGGYSEVEPLVIYSGKCHFKAWSGMGQRAGGVAERELTSTLYDVALPWSDPDYGISPSDTLYLSDAPDYGYPVVSVDHSQDRTARHITVTDEDAGTVDYA